nr:MAG TPA: hypothetical protein [Caudoviricetes sp.]
MRQAAIVHVAILRLSRVILWIALGVFASKRLDAASIIGFPLARPLET